MAGPDTTPIIRTTRSTRYPGLASDALLHCEQIDRAIEPRRFSGQLRPARNVAPGGHRPGLGPGPVRLPVQRGTRRGKTELRTADASQLFHLVHQGAVDVGAGNCLWRLRPDVRGQHLQGPGQQHQEGGVLGDAGRWWRGPWAGKIVPAEATRDPARTPTTPCVHHRSSSPRRACSQTILQRWVRAARTHLAKRSSSGKA